MRKRREAIQGELDRLIGAVASVGHSPALLKALCRRSMSRIRQFVNERLGNIRELLYTDVPRAKAELAKHATATEMAPRSGGKEGHYVAIGEWNLLVGLEGNLNDSENRARSDGCGGRI